MKLRVLWVGKTQSDWVRAGIEEYAARIRRYGQLEISEARDEKGRCMETMRTRECARLEKLVGKNARLVLLDEKGKTMSSPQFAGFIGRYRDGGISELAFARGGAYGFCDSFRERADGIVALSAMTFTHQMVRVFLLEQIYRAFTIMNGEPYHH